MAENLVQFFIEHLGGLISKELIVFVISLFPILELRGGIIAAYAMGIDLLPAFAISYIGNILPIPFILILITAIFRLLKKTPMHSIVEKIEKKALSKSDHVVIDTFSEGHLNSLLLIFIAKGILSSAI